MPALSLLSLPNLEATTSPKPNLARDFTSPPSEPPQVGLSLPTLRATTSPEPEPNLARLEVPVVHHSRGDDGQVVPVAVAAVVLAGVVTLPGLTRHTSCGGQVVTKSG